MRRHPLPWRFLRPKSNGRIGRALYSGTPFSWEQGAAEEFYQDYVRMQRDPLTSDGHTLGAVTDEIVSPLRLPSPEGRPALPTFHELSGGGYSGRLAQAFRQPARERAPRILAIAQAMRQAGEPPSSTLAYNYILSALLETGQRREAFRLVREMEARGLPPDLFTFEQVLFDLSRDLSLAITVEELVHLMRAKYGLCLSSSCWVSRLRVWLGRRQEPRVLTLFEEMRQTDKRAAADPLLYVSLIKTALMRNAWEVASHLTSCLTPTIPLRGATERDCIRPEVQATDPPVILTTADYQALLLSKISGLELRHVPYVRLFLRQLSGVPLDEGSCARVLYFAAGSGRSVADLAYLALSRLAHLYRSGTQFGGDSLPPSPSHGYEGALCENFSLPRPYLEAYVECLDREKPSNWWSGEDETEGEGEGNDSREKSVPSLFFTSGLCPHHQTLAERLKEILGKKK